jgi:3-hydroxyisobutyrate dehydrogenase
MAKNLQSKLSSNDSIHIFDLNKAAVGRLAEEMTALQAGGAAVKVAQTVNEAARESVCSHAFLIHSPFSYDETNFMI